MMPAQNYLQYLTTSTGNIAGFNWDKSTITFVSIFCQLLLRSILTLGENYNITELQFSKLTKVKTE